MAFEIIKYLPVTGATVQVAQTLLKGNARPLTAGEITMAKVIFKDSINYSSVFITQSNWSKIVHAFTGTPAISPVGIIHIGNNERYSEDYSGGSKEEWNVLMKKALFIHEMVHIWQHQMHRDVVGEAIAMSVCNTTPTTINGSRLDEAKDKLSTAGRRLDQMKSSPFHYSNPEAIKIREDQEKLVNKLQSEYDTLKSKQTIERAGRTSQSQYTYRLQSGLSIEKFQLEQQASIIEHYFLIKLQRDNPNSRTLMQFLNDNLIYVCLDYNSVADLQRIATLHEITLRDFLKNPKNPKLAVTPQYSRG